MRAARSVVEDLGEETATKSGGLVDLSKCSEANSERDVNVLARRYNLQVQVPLSNLPKPPGIRYTGDFRAIALRDWCQFLVDYNMWHLLVGLKKPDATRERAILAEFWKRYKLLYPQHQIWDTFQRHGVDPACCAPMLLHGDEGRGRKKAPFLVCAYHSMIGFGTVASNEARTRRPYLQMRLNYSGSSHLHRLLTAVLPKMHKDHVALQEICKFITADALHMVRSGIRSIHGGQYRMAILSCTGDWAWLQKAAGLNRSYSNCEKRPRAANSVPRGICHLCLAGRTNYPFEDLGRNPRYVGKQHASKLVTLLGLEDRSFWTYLMSLLVQQPGLHLISGIACTWAWGRCCVPVLSR